MDFRMASPREQRLEILQDLKQQRDDLEREINQLKEDVQSFINTVPESLALYLVYKKTIRQVLDDSKQQISAAVNPNLLLGKE